MKKGILLCLVIALFLCGCSESPDVETPLHFYYPVRNIEYEIGSSYLQPEIRDGGAVGNELTDILNLYLLGPVDKMTYTMPFQYNTQVHSLSIENGVLTLTLTQGFATYTGLPLTVACACITRTAIELTDVETVRIYAHNTTLDGAEFIEMDASSILLVDTSSQEQE